MKRSIPRIIIIGAGISGLALGWFLKNRFSDTIQLTILEAAERPGGWIRTHKKSGFLFEEGPRSCRSKGAGIDTLQLAESLGIGSELLIASPQAKKRFLYLDGKLQSVPDSSFSFLRSPLIRGLLPALWKEWRTPPSHLADESIAAFIGRRLNSSLAERLVDPLVSGIYAGDIHQLSVRSCFPEWFQQERQYGSLLKGAWAARHSRHSPIEASQRLNTHFRLEGTNVKNPIFSFKNGMETLTTALYHSLKSAIRLNCPVQTIEKRNDFLTVKTLGGEIHEADQVFLAIPALAAARLVEKESPSLSHEMSQTPYASVAIANLGWEQHVLPHEGFGYLVPFSEQQKILGVVFDSSVFPEQNSGNKQTRLTVMMGGMRHSEMINESPCKLQDNALHALKRHLGITAPPDAIHVTLARNAIPQYEVGHHERLVRIVQGINKTFPSRLTLLGSAWHGVAVNDCIAEAKRLAHMIGPLGVCNLDNSKE